MEEIDSDSLDFLIGVQGEIKRCRELAAQASDKNFTASRMTWSSGFGSLIGYSALPTPPKTGTVCQFVRAP
jgi:hypothetical protein